MKKGITAIRWILYGVLTTIIISIGLYLMCYEETYVNSYHNSSYDYFLQELNEEQAKELAQKDYVEDVFSFSVMIFGLDEKVNASQNHGEDIAFLATRSFDNLACSSFAPDSLIAEDKAILEDFSKNPIIIDYSLAKTEGLSLGDTFTLFSEKALGGKTKDFTVGAIYQNHCEFARFDAVILINEEVNADFLALDSSGGYSLAYVKAKDLPALETYLQEEFYPWLTMTYEDFKTLTPEEQRSYYLSIVERTDVAEQDMSYQKTGLIGIGLVLLFVLMVLVYTDLREKEIKSFWKCYIPVFVSIILGCMLSKWVIFPELPGEIYVPISSILLLGGILFIITTVMLLWMKRKKYTVRNS